MVVNCNAVIVLRGVLLNDFEVDSCCVVLLKIDYYVYASEELDLFDEMKLRLTLTVHDHHCCLKDFLNVYVSEILVLMKVAWSVRVRTFAFRYVTVSMEKIKRLKKIDP